jgi:hypothetical protein
MSREEMWLEDLEWIEDDEALEDTLRGVLVLFDEYGSVLTVRDSGELTSEDSTEDSTPRSAEAIRATPDSLV